MLHPTRTSCRALSLFFLRTDNCRPAPPSFSHSLDLNNTGIVVQVIRNGIIVDGTGAPSYVGDVAIKDGLILEVGAALAVKGAREVDATGKHVTPGWVDPHTHYDAQVMWDPMVTPSADNGVTTVIMGNCAVGLACVAPSGPHACTPFAARTQRAHRACCCSQAVPEAAARFHDRPVRCDRRHPGAGHQQP